MDIHRTTTTEISNVEQTQQQYSPADRGPTAWGQNQAAMGRIKREAVAVMHRARCSEPLRESRVWRLPWDSVIGVTYPNSSAAKSSEGRDLRSASRAVVPVPWPALG